MQDSLLPASLEMILSLIFCDVISSSLFRSPTVAPLVARQPFLKIGYYLCYVSDIDNSKTAYKLYILITKPELHN